MTGTVRTTVRTKEGDAQNLKVIVSGPKTVGRRF
jgi:hypothetical protein